MTYNVNRITKLALKGSRTTRLYRTSRLLLPSRNFTLKGLGFFGFFPSWKLGFTVEHSTLSGSRIDLKGFQLFKKNCHV